MLRGKNVYFKNEHVINLEEQLLESFNSRFNFMYNVALCSVHIYTTGYSFYIQI